jgi:hypothetical protein
MSRALWWVTNGLANAPPGTGWKIGVSTSTKPWSSNHRRMSDSSRLRSTNTGRDRSLAHRST